MRTLWISLIVVFGLALAGCAPSLPRAVQPTELPASNPQEIPIEAPAIDPTENPLQFQNTPESAEMPANPPSVEKFVALSKKDLAGRLQIDAEGITLLKTEEIIWPNAALGCPRPEKVYPTRRVPGFQIWLETNGTEYVYNTDFNGQVILCPELNPDIPGSIIGPTPNIGVPIP